MQNPDSFFGASGESLFRLNEVLGLNGRLLDFFGRCSDLSWAWLCVFSRVARRTLGFLRLQLLPMSGDPEWRYCEKRGKWVKDVTVESLDQVWSEVQSDQSSDSQAQSKFSKSVIEASLGSLMLGLQRLKLRRVLLHLLVALGAWQLYLRRCRRALADQRAQEAAKMVYRFNSRRWHWWMGKALECVNY